MILLYCRDVLHFMVENDEIANSVATRLVIIMFSGFSNIIY